jgi:hypothetical protein
MRPVSAQTRTGRRATAGARAIVAFTTLALATTTSCSFLAVDGPPPKEAREDIHFVCTTSWALPVLDVIGAGLAGFRAADDGSSSNASFAGAALSRDNDLLVAVVAATALFASSATGLQRVQACREATDEAKQRDAAEAAQRAAAEAAQREAAETARREAARQRGPADAGAPDGRPADGRGP